MSTKELTRQALIATIYVVVSLSFSFLSFGQHQFRVAEVLLLLAFYNRKYIVCLTLACVITNFQSPLGFVDVVLGSFATYLVLNFFAKQKGKFFLPFIAAFINALIVGIELHFVSKLPFFLSFASIFVDEFLVVFFAVVVFSHLEKYPFFKEFVS